MAFFRLLYGFFAIIFVLNFETMVIPVDVQRKWQQLKEYGDVVKIAKKARVTKPVIFNAFSSGRCSLEIYSVISKYYNDKEQKFESANPTK